jgi:hypothetical protein
MLVLLKSLLIGWGAGRFSQSKFSNCHCEEDEADGPTKRSSRFGELEDPGLASGWLAVILRQGHG